MSKMISILITSWHDEDRNRIHAILSEQNDFIIASVEKDEAGTIIKSERLKPNVLIMDLHPLSSLDGTELASIIRRRSPSTSIIMMSDKDDDSYAAMALKAGVTGFLSRNVDMNKLLLAIRIVSLGEYYISKSITERVFDTIHYYRQLPGQLAITRPMETTLSLSKTERFILTHLARGLSDKEIARDLNFNKGSIKNCLYMLKRRTKLKNRVQIVLFSLVYGYISPELLDIFRTNRQFTNDTVQLQDGGSSYEDCLRNRSGNPEL